MSTYATGDCPPDPGHYVCVHCDTKVDITAGGEQPIPKCKCPEGKGSWVERDKEYETEN